jgi:plasmid stabilization system protein ParE
MKRKVEVRLLPQAEEDFVEIIDYISDDNPLAAEKMAGRFEKSFILLSEQPLSGRLARDNRLRLLQYRYLVVDRYLIFYLVKKNKVMICRILHGARDYLTIL